MLEQVAQQGQVVVVVEDVEYADAAAMQYRIYAFRKNYRNWVVSSVADFQFLGPGESGGL